MPEESRPYHPMGNAFPDQERGLFFAELSGPKGYQKFEFAAKNCFIKPGKP